MTFEGLPTAEELRHDMRERISKLVDENKRLRTALASLLMESTAFTKLRCAEWGDSYRQTDAEQQAQAAVAGGGNGNRP
jgi:hypothetical protein